jgi:hypothetical protein
VIILNLTFIFQKLKLELHREDDVLVITIHNLQKTKVNFIVLRSMHVSQLSSNIILKI